MPRTSATDTRLDALTEAVEALALIAVGGQPGRLERSVDPSTKTAAHRLSAALAALRDHKETTE